MVSKVADMILAWRHVIITWGWNPAMPETEKADLEFKR